MCGTTSQGKLSISCHTSCHSCHYLSRAKQVHVMNPTDDEDMVKHIDEILAEVGAEAEASEAPENIELAEDDPENAERIADLLDKEEGEPGPEDMES